uniref:Schwannomin interacting protein 1 C-terminal domain-containing protein n=1 Tax=Graphocephala atropunctata TaxID=36148 RepID=A0A1B6KMA8_9HEMI
MPSLYAVRYHRERGMRLKQVEGPMVLHANRPRNIHDNGLGREYNHNSETTPKLSSTQLFQSTQWENDYNATAALATNENYNLSSLQQSEYRFLCQPSPVNSLADDEDGQHSSGTSSSDASPEAEDYRSFSQSSDTDSEDRPVAARRGIVNPNYPGFQHFASQLHSSDSEEDTTSLNNNNNNNNEEEEEISESINQLDSGGFQKTFYDKPKFNIPVDPERCNFNDKEVDSATKLVNELNIPEVISGIKIEKCAEDFSTMVDTAVLGNDGFKENNNKMADAFLSGVKVEEIQKCEDTNRAAEDCEKAASETDDAVVPRKKEKMAINLNVKKVRTQPANVAVLQPPANMTLRPLGPSRRAVRDKKRSPPEVLGSFDVYNIETAMPTIDLDAIENHLKAAREEERRRRNDREEIRRRLATGCDGDEYYGGDRPGRKPSLQARLQSGMNLQICFMNDTMSDTESPSSDSEAPAKAVSPMKQPSPLSVVPDSKPTLTANGSIKSPRGGMSLPLNEPQTEADFFACQARLQTEARLALAQAKDMARLQMEVERQRRQVSPITEMLRTTLHKVGVVFPQDRRRVSRQMLTDMNVAQLQVIVNDLHTQIEYLNESLVKFLMERDDLHMGQDSMLVDIEDLTRYLGAKENTLKEDISFNNNLPAIKPKGNRVAALVRK